jgi:hypothetical protein
MNWKTLFLGVAFIVLIGIGGLVYRNAVERTSQPVACPLDAKMCPDGTAVGRTGPSCQFPACPPPNVTLPEIGISFAVPEGSTSATLPDEAAIAAYALFEDAAATGGDSIYIRRYPLTGSTTALSVIQETAIGDATGEPVSATALSSRELGTRRYTVAMLGRFEGVISTAYYLARQNDVLRFDAIDREVSNWTDPRLDISTLPAHAALIKILTTLQADSQ